MTFMENKINAKNVYFFHYTKHFYSYDKKELWHTEM